MNDWYKYYCFKPPYKEYFVIWLLFMYGKTEYNRT